MTIFLLGYMGCGKTTLGAPLADRLGVNFIDLDDYIEEQCETTIVQIFNKVGDHGFREIEAKALQQVAMAAGGAVVAVGGGTPCQPGNMELMNRCGLTIWLDPTLDRIVSRLCLPEQRVKRPLICDMTDDEIRAYAAAGIEQRSQHYSKAMLRFDSSRLESPEEIADTAARLADILTA